MSNNRYDVKEILHENTETGATVYHAIDTINNLHVVIKDIPLHNTVHNTIFSREIEALNILRETKHIVRIWDYFAGNNKNGKAIGRIILQYIEGYALENCLYDISNNRTKYSIIKQLVSAIRDAHNKGIIHRDINPSNVMIDGELNVTLIDFGIAKIKSMITKGTTMMFATNRYVAPEVSYHPENTNEQTDIYSLGALIYYLFTNKEPPLPEKFDETIKTATGMDSDLKRVVRKMVSPIECRYVDIQSVESDLYRLFDKYLKNDEVYIVYLPFDKIMQMYNNYLVTTRNIQSAINDDIKSNFNESYIEIRRDEKSDSYVIYGYTYLFECIYNVELQQLQVTGFKTINPHKREKARRNCYEVTGNFLFVSSNVGNAGYLDIENHTQILINKVKRHANEANSSENINNVFNENFGIWNTYLNGKIEQIRKNAIRYHYCSYDVDGTIVKFELDKSKKQPEFDIDQEMTLIFEKKEKNRITEVEIGKYIKMENNGHTMLVDTSLIAQKKKSYKMPLTGSICIDYTYKTIQCERQKKAIFECIRGDFHTTGNLKSIMTGMEPVSMINNISSIKYFDERLDSSQQMAVKKALQVQDFMLIQGPPGTGKTNVIIEIIRQVIKKNRKFAVSPEKILVVSQAHSAVDKILEDLDHHLDKENVLRIASANAAEKMSDLAKSKYSVQQKKELWINGVSKKSKASLDIRTYQYLK
ncbi:protein kinase [Christensenellaceae bacterium OttesenSCG-928-K19]|nr:protein kinase [Christensenellaceae bacterium OttesenSCG-928-K19]